MINRLKRRFIILAMVSLTLLLSVIVAGMNIINYNTVVSNADRTLEIISDNQGRLPMLFDDGLDDIYSDFEDEIEDIYRRMDEYDDIDSETGDYSWRYGSGPDTGGRRGSAPGEMSRDEAEETRFFTVLVNYNGEAAWIDTGRIFAVDSDQAAEYAEKVAASGTEKGFVGEYRYSVTEEGMFTRVTFLDCGRTLSAFRDFLRTSVLMSVVGLLAVFAVICYFAGRIVRPVAESYEKQKRFITDAGHEIKTPLAIVKANIDVMRMDLEDIRIAEDGSDAGPEGGADSDSFSGNTALNAVESLNESLSDISGQVDRLTSLTNDLVYLSRMEEGGNSLTMAEIPVSDIVSETVDSFDALARERKKTISSDITPMLSMNGSSKEIEKLVSVLVENALKYSPEDDTVGVSLSREGKNIILEVSNRTAEPVSDEDLEHIFERFYRTDKSRNSAAGGHGIGLSVASAIVTAHGGRIRARSGDGSEFIVTASMPA